MGGDYGLTQFEFDEEMDLKNYRVWVGDLIHGLPHWTPLFIWAWCYGCANGMQYAAETLSIPESKGWDWRIVDGIAYLAVIEPKPEEVPGRQRVFSEKMVEIIESYDQLWQEDVDEIMNYYERFKKVEIEKVSNVELQQLFVDWVYYGHRRWWEIHFYWMYALYTFYNLFESTLEELTGIKGDDPLVNDLMGGMNNILFRINKEIWQLGKKAVEMELEEIFVTSEDEKEIYIRLQESESGKKWLEEYNTFLQKYGWRCARMMDWATPTWIEDPTLGLKDIRASMASQGEFTLDEKREELEKKRRKAEKEILGKVPEDKKDWFAKLLKMAQNCGCWSEEHNFYLDLMGHAIGRKLTWEIGKRFAKAGVIDDPNDVYFLAPWEIHKAIIVLERVNLRSYVEKRRKEWEENRKKPPVPFLGNVEALGDIITKDAVVKIEASPPKVKEELKADLYGAGAAPGVVEGVARVVMDESGLTEVQPGEILVAPTTSAPWTPVFSIIRGVVTDHGGCLAHAAIVAREYGIPAVVGTHEATQKIKTGMRIKVDGTKNCVWILG